MINKYKSLPLSVNKLLLVALFISIFFILKAYTNHLINAYNYPFSWFLTSVKIFIGFLLWVVLSPWIYSLVKLVSTKRKITFKTIFKIAIGCIILAVLHSVISNRLNDLVNYFNTGYLKNFFGKSNFSILVVGVFTSFIELLVVEALLFALDYQKKYITNQKRLISAQLSALQMQLQPHFLFNTLHSIASMIDINSKDAQKMLTKLGRLLRKVLEYNEEQMVTVVDEIKFIKDYLDLEQIRYQDRLKINYTIAEDTLSLKIPSMIFQPLVENAIKYGAVSIVENGEINIEIEKKHSIELKEELLSMTISNTFNASNIKTKKGTGIGLKNIRERLQSLYQDHFKLVSTFVSDELYVAKIEIPIV